MCSMVVFYLCRYLDAETLLEQDIQIEIWPIGSRQGYIMNPQLFSDIQVLIRVASLLNH